MIEPEVGSRRRAIVIAGFLGDQQGARAALRDDAASVRAAALTALSRCGHLDSSDIEEALTDEAAAVRRRACQLAAKLSVIDLAPSLRDEDASVVEIAAWASGEQVPTSPTAVKGLCDVARNHDDALSREAAVAALGAIGDSTALDTILAALEDKAPIRRRAILALAPFDGPAVDSALRSALEDRDWQVRQAAEDIMS